MTTTQTELFKEVFTGARTIFEPARPVSSNNQTPVSFSGLPPPAPASISDHIADDGKKAQLVKECKEEKNENNRS